MAFKSVAVPVGTGDTDVFEMPATLQGAVVLGIGNVNGSARTVTLKFYNANDDETVTIVSGYSIAANTMVKWPIPILMATGDKIIMSASNADSINAHASITDSASAPVATGFTPRGGWDNAITYNANDLVRVEDAISTGRGATYVAKVNESSNLNQDPTTETSFWMLYVADGPEGDLSAADIGVTVQAYDADTAKLDVAQTWTAVQKFMALKEKVTITADNPAATTNFDVLTQAVEYYTTANDTNWTLNVRGSSGASLDSIMSTGESITIAVIVTNTGTAYRQTAMTIDGNAVTPQWLGSAAPSAGTVNKRDTYTHTIIKTGSATFIVQSSFAAGN